MSNPLTILAGIIRLLLTTLHETWMNRSKGAGLVIEEIVKQVYFTAVQPFWIVTIAAAIIGLGFGLEISMLLSSIGNPAIINKLFFDLSLGEISPLVTALVVAGRSGSAVAAEMSTLVCNEEINSYKSMGISVEHLLVFPRLIGITFAVLLLSIYFVAVTVVAGAILVYLQGGVPFTIYLSRIFEEGSHGRLSLFVLKNLVNGIVITLICVYSGININPSLTEVPRAVSRAMIRTFFALLATSALFAIIAYT